VRSIGEQCERAGQERRRRFHRDEGDGERERRLEPTTLRAAVRRNASPWLWSWLWLWSPGTLPFSPLGTAPGSLRSSPWHRSSRGSSKVILRERSCGVIRMRRLPLHQSDARWPHTRGPREEVTTGSTSSPARRAPLPGGADHRTRAGRRALASSHRRHDRRRRSPHVHIHVVPFDSVVELRSPTPIRTLPPARSTRPQPRSVRALRDLGSEFVSD